MSSTPQSTSKEQPFPYVQLGTLALCRLAEPIALMSILPYAYSMVKHFDFGTPLQAGLWSGILISSFSICEAAVCPFWGALSDKVGRKPVLLAGMSGTMLSMLMMGFARSYRFALAARCIGGFLNGNIGVIQTIVGESCPNPDHQPRAFAFMPTVWLLGSIIGPSISAFAIGRVWPNQPYLLPNLICALILGLGIIIGWALLEETNPSLVSKRKSDELWKTQQAKSPILKSNSGHSYGTFSRVSSEDTLIGSEHDISEYLSLSHKRSIKALSPAGDDGQSSSCEPVFTRRICLLFGALTLFSYHNMCFDHLFPILLVDARQSSHGTGLPIGGLGFSQQHVGLIASLQGALALLIQVFVMPPLTKGIGVFRLFQISVLAHPLVYILPPFLPALCGLPSWVLYTALLAEMLLCNLAAIILYPLILILIKDAAPRLSVLGRINGVAASCGALARALAPPLAGYFHGVGETNRIPGLAWWSAGIVAIVGCVQMTMIKREGKVVDDDRPDWLLGDESAIESDSESEESDSEMEDRSQRPCVECRGWRYYYGRYHHDSLRQAGWKSKGSLPKPGAC